MSASPATSKQKEHAVRVVAEAHEIAILELNPDHDAYQRFFKRQGEFNHAFVALVRRLMTEESDYTLARSILGGDFITPEEIMVARPDVVYSPEQIAELAASIPSEEVLRSLKANGNGFMPQPPEALSLLDIRSAKPVLFPSEMEEVWYANQAFAQNDMTGTGWLSIDLKRNFDEHNKLLTNAEYVPNAAEVSWFITIFYDVRRVWLFQDWRSVNTSSFRSDGRRVNVGCGTKGLNIAIVWDGRPCDDILGLASAWKF